MARPSSATFAEQFLPFVVEGLKVVDAFIADHVDQLAGVESGKLFDTSQLS